MLYEQINLKNPNHLLIVVITMLSFTGFSFGAFLVSNQNLIPTKTQAVLGSDSEQNIRDLTPLTNDQNDAEISANKVAYLSHVNGNSSKPELFVTDLTNSSQVQISSGGVNPYGNTAFGIDGNKVVYQTFDSGASGPINIYVYDLSTNVRTKITNDSCHSLYPAISGDTVVYASDKNNGCALTNYDIYSYNLATSVETRLTTDASNQFSPEISGNKVVFVDNRHGNSEIYIYDLATSAESRVTNNSTSDTEPDISGNRIVWQGQSANYDIFTYNISTASTTQITNHSTSQLGPSIDGNKIVWTDYRNGGTNADIYQYDLASSAEGQITFNTTYQYRPDVSGEKIVWVDERNGNTNKDIYISEPPVVSSPPPSGNPPPVVPPGTTPPGTLPPAPFKKVTICHKNGSGKYEVVTVSEQAVLNGHRTHSGDIIPSTPDCRPPTIKEVSLPDKFKPGITETTDLSTVADPSKVANLILDTGANKIKFNEDIDLSSADTIDKFKNLDAYVKCDKTGVIAIDSAALPALNKKATLTMNGLSFTKTPRILVDGKEDKKAVTNLKYVKGVLSFDVNHFSTYTAAASITIESPQNNFESREKKITLKGTVSDPTATVSAKLNSQNLGKLKIASGSGSFNLNVDLEKGLNTIVVSAVSVSGASVSTKIVGTLISSQSILLPVVFGSFIVLLVLSGVLYLLKFRKKKDSVANLSQDSSLKQ